jgi:nucleoside phosphorylase
MATAATTVDDRWVERNLGIEYGGLEAERLQGHARVAAAEGIAESAQVVGDEGRRLRRELIEFDSEGPDGNAFRKLAAAAPGGLAKFVDISWPRGLEPRPGGRPRGRSLPKADVLMVTWTVDEGHALSRVLSPGFDSRDDWRPYTKNYTTISAHMRAGCPARELERLGTYWTATIGEQRVTLFKSDSHMSQDGPDLANAQVWRQIIEDTDPRWVISTGTGGGIGPHFEVGDVIVSRYATFDCQQEFKQLDGNSYSCPTNPSAKRFERAEQLFKANAQSLPRDNKRPPRISEAAAPHLGILTTDFFGFDNTADTYGLQGKGSLSEMGDAVLGMVCDELGAKAPLYTIVRNVSDPQINSHALTLRQQTTIAADIYKAYGRWSSVCSAIVCWAIAAGL